MNTQQACRDIVSEARGELRKIFPKGFTRPFKEGRDLAKEYCARHSVEFVKQENGGIDWVEAAQKTLAELRSLVRDFNADESPDASQQTKLRIFSVAHRVAFDVTMVELLRHKPPKQKSMKETFDCFCEDAKDKKRSIDYVRNNNIIDAICEEVAKDVRAGELCDNDALNARAMALTELAEISICEADDVQAYGGFASYLHACVLFRVTEGKVYGVRVDDGKLALA